MKRIFLGKVYIGRVIDFESYIYNIALYIFITAIFERHVDIEKITDIPNEYITWRNFGLSLFLASSRVVVNNFNSSYILNRGLQIRVKGLDFKKCTLRGRHMIYKHGA